MYAQSNPPAAVALYAPSHTHTACSIPDDLGWVGESMSSEMRAFMPQLEWPLQFLANFGPFLVTVSGEPCPISSLSTVSQIVIDIGAVACGIAITFP